MHFVWCEIQHQLSEYACAEDTNGFHLTIAICHANLLLCMYVCDYKTNTNDLSHAASNRYDSIESTARRDDSKQTIHISHHVLLMYLEYVYMQYASQRQ